MGRSLSDQLVGLFLYVTFILGVILLIGAISRFVHGEHGTGMVLLIPALLLFGVNMLLFRFTKYRDNQQP